MTNWFLATEKSLVVKKDKEKQMSICKLNDQLIMARQSGNTKLVNLITLVIKKIDPNYKFS